MAEQRARAKADAQAKKTGHARPVAVPRGAGARASHEFTGYTEVAREATVTALIGGDGLLPAAQRGRRGRGRARRDPVLRRGRRPAAPTGAGCASTRAAARRSSTVIDVQQPLPGLIAHRATVLSGEVRPGDVGAGRGRRRAAGVGVAQPLRDPPAARGAAARARRHAPRRPARSTRRAGCASTSPRRRRCRTACSATSRTRSTRCCCATSRCAGSSPTRTRRAGSAPSRCSARSTATGCASSRSATTRASCAAAPTCRAARSSAWSSCSARRRSAPACAGSRRSSASTRSATSPASTCSSSRWPSEFKAPAGRAARADQRRARPAQVGRAGAGQAARRRRCSPAPGALAAAAEDVGGVQLVRPQAPAGSAATTCARWRWTCAAGCGPAIPAVVAARLAGRRRRSGVRRRGQRRRSGGGPVARASWSAAFAPVLGARGGGKADLAQGAGGDAAKLDDAFDAVRRAISER